VRHAPGLVRWLQLMLQSISNTPPPVSTVALATERLLWKSMNSVQSFGEYGYVCELLGVGDLQNAELAKGYLFPHKVDVKLDVLGSLMMHWVLGHVHA
jgi:hypothetical protein